MYWRGKLTRQQSSSLGGPSMTLNVLARLPAPHVQSAHVANAGLEDGLGNGDCKASGDGLGDPSGLGDGESSGLHTTPQQKQ